MKVSVGACVLDAARLIAGEDTLLAVISTVACAGPCAVLPELGSRGLPISRAMVFLCTAAVVTWGWVGGFSRHPALCADPVACPAGRGFG